MGFSTFKRGQLVPVTLLLLVGSLCFSSVQAVVQFRRHGIPRRVFDVRAYGAAADGRTDNSQAFLRAWDEACRSRGRKVVRIPNGQYLVKTVSFRGPCNGPMMFEIWGTLVAPTDPSDFFTDTWIAFRYVDNLDVRGYAPGGVLDGRGASAWNYNDCSNNPRCRPLPATLRLDFVTNSRIHYLRSVNSKNVHINLFACSNIVISKVALTAPAESPNTDGIRIGLSNRIIITSAYIGTGDDCIAMVSGSQNIDISDITCGPGHGISIGSLGGGRTHEFVDGISIRNCTFVGTDNGARIKTWAPSSPSLAANIFYVDLVMKNVKNPILIDQQYCPKKTCPPGNSLVELQNVTFRNIRGISSTKVAVNLQCSQIRPCKNVNLNNIDLRYEGQGGKAQATCSNVLGTSYGKNNPSGCLK